MQALLWVPPLAFDTPHLQRDRTTLATNAHR
jgi:hypothetical protein